MIHGNYHIFRDPIHGFIKVYAVEKEIIDSAPFQRLRYIKQLGLSNLVYHGADHTRFAHSLGMMEFATRIFETLFTKDGDSFKDRYGWDDSNFQAVLQRVRLAGLLHDIGHAPFSHASEGLFPEGQDHETYGLKIISTEPIYGIINKYAEQTGVTLEEVSDLLGKKQLRENAFLKQIIAGELDADRMDYLLRDSLYTGVKYGKFDYDRLIETLCLVERGDGGFDIGIEERGKHAAEMLILARYFMFTQVYFHPVRRVYDIHLHQLIAEMLEGKRFPEYPADYLKWDDIKVLAYARGKQDESEAARRILNRKHYECIGSTREHPEPDEVHKFDNCFRELVQKYGKECILQDLSDKAPYSYKEQTELLLKKRDMGNIVPFRSESKLVDSLEKIYQLRVYAEPGIAKEARKLYAGFEKE